MDFQIVNRTASSFNEAVGISEERANELSDKLDEITKKHRWHVVYVADIFRQIAEICNTPEELVYCTINHCNYVAMKYGIFFCPPQNKAKS